MAKKYLSMRDIAEKAGVSTSTVSRVINQRGKYSSETANKVNSIITKYGYVPNLSVKNIFAGHADTIAFFTFNISNPFYASIVKHLNHITMANNYNLLIYDTANGKMDTNRFYEHCKGMRVAGIINSATSIHSTINHDSPIPLVLLAESNDCKIYDCVINHDYDNSIYMLTDYLCRLNHRKIGFITGTLDFYPGTARLESFKKNMEKYDLPYPPNYIYEGDFSIESGVRAFDHFYSLPDGPTAIIASNDLMAKGFIMRASSMGVRIPEDFSVCGIDAIDDDYFYPTITSAQQDTKLFAQYAFDFIANYDKKKEKARRDNH